MAVSATEAPKSLLITCINHQMNYVIGTPSMGSTTQFSKTFHTNCLTASLSNVYSWAGLVLLSRKWKRGELSVYFVARISSF